ncbi:TLD domain-containing protein 1-like [Dendronephthya gigantea]|uniref:TLD domain-containing protein 1-like n=1 Tax=Dendronephthya gigantea TaxID=151771 RepID=UPI00106D9022|nr:TLD domain-containing protein 1-like [Dendronephthya gigantea]
MGATVSKDTELENALSKLDEGQQEKLEAVFDSLSSNNILDACKFKNHLSPYFPANFTDRIYNTFKHNTHEKRVSTMEVQKRDFMVGISKLLKGYLNEKALILHAMSTTNNQSNRQALFELCQILVKAYIKAVEKSSVGLSFMKAGTTQEANKNLAEQLTSCIPEEKHGNMTIDDVETWIRKEVLVMRLFEDVFKACFFGADSILDTQRHGLKEGCEPSVEHVPRTDILLPCKLDFQGHNIETIIDIPAMLRLNHAVPLECRHNWRLLFATSCHGKSFTTFLHQIVYQGPTVLLVKDREGAVFGGFASTSWRVKSNFEGDKDCFVFTMKPSMAIYHPTGINDHYMYLNIGMKTIPNGLGMGGQFEYFGLWLDSEFGPGHSKARPKCTTYGNPQLSASEEFEIEEIEVWGVGVPPEQEESKRSVLDRETDAQAILDLIGKERKSDGFREPEDME